MKALLLSAYAAHSHVHWQQRLLAMFPRWHWEILSLPPRHFSWRVRGNPLYWALQERQRLQHHHDILIATSMVDLATLRGLVPALARLPSLLYFHENQFDYPSRAGQGSLLEAQMVSLYSALAADRLAFNSGYNRDTFLAGLDALLRKLPDKVPVGVVAALAAKTVVLPVPVDSDSAPAAAASGWPGTRGNFPGRPLRLVWSGRLEHDKGGETLWYTLAALERAGLRYELALTGQQFRNAPPVFARIEADYGHRLVHFGFLPALTDYLALLRAADLVLATAHHEFQGIAVLQAVAAGCLPVVPDRQVYPEIYPRRFRYSSQPEQPTGEGEAAAALICRLAAGLERGEVAPPDVSAFSAIRLQPRYRALFDSMAGVAG